MVRPKTDLATFDPVAVAFACNNQWRGRLSPADAREVVRRLVKRGYSDGQIGAAAGRTRRQVMRIRAELGLKAPLPSGNWLGVRIEGLPCLPKEAY